MRTSILLLSVALAVFPTSVVAEPGTYRPPRHVHGHPDFEGVWTNTNATPLVRPPGYTQLFISAAEAREIDLRRIASDEDRSTPTEPTEWTDERSIEPVNGPAKRTSRAATSA